MHAILFQAFGSWQRLAAHLYTCIGFPTRAQMLPASVEGHYSAPMAFVLTKLQLSNNTCDIAIPGGSRAWSRLETRKCTKSNT